MPQPQAAAEQPFKPSAPPRGHCQRPQLVKGKSPQGPRVTVQIEQYSLCSAAQLTSCSSPAATASRLTSSLLPHVSLGASQLLKPASTTPRSYGIGIGLGTTNRRRKPIVETCVDNTAKLQPQASVLAPRQFICNAQRAVKSSRVSTLPKAKSQTRSKQNKDMHKCSSVYSERGVPLPVLTSGGE